MVVLCPEECWCELGEYVDCSDLSLNNIPLIFPRNFFSLALDDNNITSLQKDIFISRGLTELGELSMEYCGLETIELGAFNGFTKLIVLSMSGNNISKIIPRTFEKMSRLKYLYLSHNRLQY
jgi:Leucine-rich repeat (LRR) protein